MQVGAYADGRPLSFEPATGEYDVGGAFITLEQLSAYEAHGQIAWLPGYGRTSHMPARMTSANTYLDSPLSSTEYALYTLVFLLIPYACVFVSSILYYVWRGDRPNRAAQINKLGFIVFGCQLLLGCMLIGLSAGLPS